MKNKLYKVYKKYKNIILITSIILLVGIIGMIIFINSNSELKLVDTSNYSLQYDKSWKIKEKKDNYIVFKHRSSNSRLKIEIIELDKEYKYDTIDDLLDEIIYNIGSQNKNYKLISNYSDTFTKMNFSGYKLLYEIDNEQVMVCVFKKSDKLIFISYEASSEYFDILLDSVQNIIYNFNTVDEQFNIENSLKLNISKAKYSNINTNGLNKLFEDKKEYEIAYNNYKVVYSIPSSFEARTLNTTWAYFRLDDLEDKVIDSSSINSNISISVSIYNKNVFEYIEDEKSSTKRYYNNEEYTDVKEQLSKLDTKYDDTYFYKLSYKNTEESINYTWTTEEGKIVYSLNKNHILVISINAINVSITKELIDSITVKDIKNYLYYTNSTKEDGYITSIMQRYDSDKDKGNFKINIKLPDTYEEEDRNSNQYLDRYFNLNYNENKELYDYEVHYYLTGDFYDVDKALNILHTYFTESYGECNYYKRTGNIQVNDKSFEVYQGGYTDSSVFISLTDSGYKYYKNHKALFYELDEGGYLIVEIKGNGKEITDDIIKEVTNFEIKY